MTEKRKEIFIILGIILGALLIHTVYLGDLRHTAQFPAVQYSDGYYYYTWAQDIASGSVIGNRVFMKWPLYAYFLALLLRLSAGNILFVYVVQSFLNALTFALVYLIARRLFDRTAALWAAVLCAVYSLFVFYAGLMLYTTLAVFLSVLFCYWLIRIEFNPSEQKLFAPGVLAGFCVLAQGNSVFFVVPAALWVIMRQKYPWERVLSMAGAFLLGMGIVIGSVAARNYFVSRDFVPIAANTGINFYIGNNPEADGLFYSPENIACNQEGMFRDAKALARVDAGEFLKPSQVSSYWFTRGMSFLARHPIVALKLYLRKLYYLFNINEPVHDLEYTHIKDSLRVLVLLVSDLRLILPLGFIGMWLNRRRWKEDGLLYIAIAAFSLSLLPFFITSRYRILFVPFLAVFAGTGISGMWREVHKKNFRRLGMLIAGTLLIYLVFSRPFVQNTRARRIQDRVGRVQAYIDHSLQWLGLFDQDKAIYYAGKAYEMQPNHYAGLYVQGYIYNTLGNTRDAERVLLETITRFPYCTWAYRLLGQMYLFQGRFADASRMLEQGARLEEDDAQLYYDLGRAYMFLSEMDKATEYFQKALQKTTPRTRALRNSILSDLETVSY